MGESNQIQLSCGQRHLFQAEMAHREMQMGGHEFPPHPQHMVFPSAMFSFVHSEAAWHFSQFSPAHTSSHGCLFCQPGLLQKGAGRND